MATNQFKRLSIVLYSYPTEDLLLNLGVDKYAFIEHLYDTRTEKDYNDYIYKNGVAPTWNIGDLKDPHYHLYINLLKKKTLAGVYNIINKWKENSTQPFLIIALDNESGFIRYLTHIDNPEKYQYSPSEIISNFDINLFFAIQLSDSDFCKNVIYLINERKICSFKDIVNYSFQVGKIELVMKRSYFFKQLLLF